MIKGFASPSFRNCPKRVPKRLTCYEVSWGWRTAVGPLDFMFSRTHKLESAKASALGEALPRGGATYLSCRLLGRTAEPTSSAEEANTDTVPPMRPSTCPLRALERSRILPNRFNRDLWTAAACAWSVSPAGASAAITRSGWAGDGVRRWDGVTFTDFPKPLDVIGARVDSW